jgi:F0F1-type ATP synthase assembly protein I
VQFLEILFRLGVVFAIFGFIWALISFGIMLLSGGNALKYPLKLSLKLVQYILISNVSILFSLNFNGSTTSFIVGLILLSFFLGKTQNLQVKMIIQSNFSPKQKNEKPNMSYELGVVVLAMAFYVFFLFNPEFTQSVLAKWFYTTIRDIEKAPIFGFIFKVIGFFVSISMIIRMVNAIQNLISGNAQKPPRDKFNGGMNEGGLDQNKWDVYEDVSDEK